MEEGATKKKKKIDWNAVSVKIVNISLWFVGLSFPIFLLAWGVKACQDSSERDAIHRQKIDSFVEKKGPFDLGTLVPIEGKGSSFNDVVNSRRKNYKTYFIVKSKKGVIYPIEDFSSDNIYLVGGDTSRIPKIKFKSWYYGRRIYEKAVKGEYTLDDYYYNWRERSLYREENILIYIRKEDVSKYIKLSKK